MRLTIKSPFTKSIDWRTPLVRRPKQVLQPLNRRAWKQMDSMFNTVIQFYKEDNNE
jgi:hypothetical protein